MVCSPNDPSEIIRWFLICQKYWSPIHVYTPNSVLPSALGGISLWTLGYPEPLGIVLSVASSSLFPEMITQCLSILMLSFYSYAFAAQKWPPSIRRLSSSPAITTPVFSFIKMRILKISFIHPLRGHVQALFPLATHTKRKR